MHAPRVCVRACGGVPVLLDNVGAAGVGSVLPAGKLALTGVLGHSTCLRALSDPRRGVYVFSCERPRRASIDIHSHALAGPLSSQSASPIHQRAAISPSTRLACAQHMRESEIHALPIPPPRAQ